MHILHTVLINVLRLCPCSSPQAFPFQLSRGSGAGPGFATPACPPAWGSCDLVPSLGWHFPPFNLSTSKSLFPSQTVKFAHPSGGLAQVGLVSWVNVCWNVWMSSPREDFARAGDCLATAVLAAAMERQSGRDSG